MENLFTRPLLQRKLEEILYEVFRDDIKESENFFSFDLLDACPLAI